MKNISKRNNINILGNGNKLMIMAHGFGCDQHVWDFIRKDFEDEYTLVLFDYVGAGKSDLNAYNDKRYGSLKGYAQDVLEICNELKIKDSIFVGHSVSSMIGLLAAVQEPSYFSKLVFIGPSPRYLNDEGYKGGFERADLDGLFDLMDSNYLGWSAALGPAIMGNAERPELGSMLTNNFCATNPEIARQFARVTFLSDNRADLAALKVDSLTMQCSNDIIAPMEVGYYMEANTPGNKLAVMNATGHCPHLSAPAETVSVMRQFLN